MTDNNIYEQHKAAFANVSAYVVMSGAERVATIAFKFPRDGAGRLYAYVHWFGQTMVRGYAAGGGYDKSSAAVFNALKKMSAYKDGDNTPADHAVFVLAVKDTGQSWDRDLRDAGFSVMQAV